MPKMKRPAIDRFLEKVEKADDDREGCWRWTASTKHGGYGQFNDGGMQGAHRWAHAYFVGPVPKGVNVRQTCGDRLCVNPAHLYLTSRRAG